MKKTGFYVIGGQHIYVCYGHKETLHAAKLLASANREYWDNWQGWHTPAIYAAEDCREIDTAADGWYNGRTIIAPKLGASPVAVYDRVTRRWYLLGNQ